MKQAHEQLGLEISSALAKEIMHKDHNMQYRRIQANSWQQNSDVNRVLRQQYAMVYLGLLRNQKVLLNVDES